MRLGVYLSTRVAFRGIRAALYGILTLDGELGLVCGIHCARAFDRAALPPLLLASALPLGDSLDAVGKFPPNERGPQEPGAAEASVRQGRGGQRLGWGLWGGELPLIGGLGLFGVPRCIVGLGPDGEVSPFWNSEAKSLESEGALEAGGMKGRDMEERYAA